MGGEYRDESGNSRGTTGYGDFISEKYTRNNIKRNIIQNHIETRDKRKIRVGMYQWGKVGTLLGGK